MPPTDDERASDTSLAHPKRNKVVSRRHAQKVMFMGIVASPKLLDDGTTFDGRIMLKRVAELKKSSRGGGNQRFTDDAVLNSEIKNGSWRQYYVPGMTVLELLNVVAEMYELEPNILERMQLKFRPKESANWKRLHDNNTIDSYKLANGIGITVHDISLEVYYTAGEEVTKDVNCDSKFMLDSMDEIGESIREKMSWVPLTTTIILFMDNAGGHGTDNAVKQYTQHLLHRYRIQIVQQVPRSPETNLLDLGIWRSIQSAVENEHRLKRYEANALARSVERAWNHRLKPTVFQNVYGRLLQVFTLIVLDNGDNNLVESKRGKLFSDPLMPEGPVILEENDEQPAVQNENEDLVQYL